MRSRSRNPYPSPARDVLSGHAHWMKDGRCNDGRGTLVNVFFPAPAESGTVSPSEAAAKRVCMGCPVREECLDFALLNGEQFGVWGGATESERRRIIKISRQRNRRMG